MNNYYDIIAKELANKYNIYDYRLENNIMKYYEVLTDGTYEHQINLDTFEHNACSIINIEWR